MGSAFDTRSGEVAVGDPVMGLVRFRLAGPGAYALGPGALRPVAEDAEGMSLDGPYVFAVDAVHAEELTRWFHRVGREHNYDVLLVTERLSELETAIGCRVGFYWEQELAGATREGRYTLDLTGVRKTG